MDLPAFGCFARQCRFVRPQCFRKSKIGRTYGCPNRLIFATSSKFPTEYGSVSPYRQLFNVAGISDRKKEYSERKLVGYSMEQMYNVVADVGNYKSFVPFCRSSIITLSRPGLVKADLVIGFSVVTESYTSSVTLVRPNLVKAVCTEGTLFNHLLTVWKFCPGLKSKPQSCIIDFSVSFEFRSSLHSRLSHIFFNEVVRQMENAFITEAKRRYGTPSVKSRKLGFLTMRS
ncbi:coenzyme Q-binding protein COQ10 homolog B, mitochondrial [Ischnura elegans]|uniref:coenzyme Q-binding protein COQ10 homolog B, mitochondrial n=1 Tax=Ischnura elegans TaxID=197161 RepID=UPI001ED87EB7|nr:coenzyme Q-binding protein COQ10 homolog B, mitochondrial [Ischnura elegans]